MLFTEARFLVFFAVVLAVYWSVPRNRPRKAWLLVASYTFYGAWDPRFLALIVGSTVLDFVVGGAMAKRDVPSRRRWLLALSLAGNLGCLALFKYYDFFVTSATGLLSLLGLDVEPRTLGLILPVGISFYTFQSLSYTIDIYRGKLAPIRSFPDFALFVSFFPQLVAGPIVRASEFLPQLDERRAWRDVEVRACLTLFLIGYVKKTCVSDNFAPLIDPVFADPSTYDVASLWLASLMYTVRIYCDFSGYSDMAIATAGLLGYRLVQNFHFPYLAASITDFWRRWHMSLSRWFRDYLYVPLGGNRGSALATYRNLVIVFFLCGLWHGANWTFVVWGLYHGGFLVLERLLPGDRERGVHPLFDRVYVLLVALVGWVFFRCQTLSSALDYLGGLFLGRAGETTVDLRFGWAVALFSVVHWLSRDDRMMRAARRVPEPLFAIGLGVAAALALLFSPEDYAAFIYFQF